MGKPFWKTKPLQQMTRDEWESLCDGCGRCCLHKLRHEDDNALTFTNIACRLLDLETCRCTDYATAAPGARLRQPDPRETAGDRLAAAFLRLCPAARRQGAGVSCPITWPRR